MIELIKEHWVISILSTLVLGALGSGLWEIVFKPLFKKLGELLFYVLTLGVQRTRDSVYLDAAKNHREQGGIFVARHMSLIFASTLIAFSFLSFQASYGNHGLFSEISTCTKFEKENRDCIRQAAKERLEKIVLIAIPLFIFLAVVLMYTSLRIERVYRISTDFNQYLTICKPYISNENLVNLEKDFALMKNKNDYELLLNQLREIAKRNDHDLPRINA